MKKLSIGLSIAALSLAGAAYADNHGGMHSGMNADTDNDGVITRAEMQAQTAVWFARMDANNDGKLDQTDREARHAERRARMFDRLDADNNGQISKDEFATAERMGKRGGGKDDGERWGHKRGGHAGMPMMKMADTNGDDSVSQAEFSAAAGKHFDMMDTDNDGKVTKEERQTARKAMHEKWRAMKSDHSDG